MSAPEVWGIPEVDGFIDAMSRATRFAELRKERQQLAAHQTNPKCGDCYNWMKSSMCPREHNVRGQTTGPSCNGARCESFVWDGPIRAALDKAIASNEEAIAKAGGQQ